VQVTYCRQLWDDHGTRKFLEFDEIEEFAFRQFFTQLRLLHQKRHLFTRLQSSYQLLKERQAAATAAAVPGTGSRGTGPKHKALLQVSPPPPPNARPPSPDPLQLSKEVSSLSQELSTLQADLTSFHQASTLRAEQFSSSHLQPALHLSLGHTKVILLDSLWSQAITRTGYAVDGPLRKREIEVNMSEEVPPSCLPPRPSLPPPVPGFSLT
jgi:hypothetical protein